MTHEHMLTQIVSELTKRDSHVIDHNVNCKDGMLLSSSICLPSGYRKGELPTVPVEINTAIEVNNIREIDDKKMTISLEFHPQLVWADNRIVTNFTEQEKKSGKVLNNVNLEYIWKPDLLIENLCEFKLHSVLEDLSGLAIGNGLALGLKNETVIWYEFSAKAVIYCNFDFLRYPMDNQQCNFTIGTTYPAKGTIIFTFHASSVFNFGKATQNTDDFDLDIEDVNSNMENNTKFGFTIKMSRKLQPFIMECYLPCIAIVIVSQISFLIPLDAVPGRVALLVTQFLTLTNINVHQQVS
jgi:gamma-aminobutyric acid receptor subunit alpha